MRKLLGIVLATMVWGAATAGAAVYEYADQLTEWPGYETALNSHDIWGNPDVLGMRVVTTDSGYLSSITVNFDSDYGFGLTNNSDFSSLFINAQARARESYDNWDYYLKLTNINGGYKAEAYDLTDVYNFSYTYPAENSGYRDGHPNGIDTTGLQTTNAILASFGFLYGLDGVNSMIFNFKNEAIYLGNTFFIGFTEYCANDNFLNTNPVPEPATLVLLGSGLLGVAVFRRRTTKA